jgi:hypothetical protein
VVEFLASVIDPQRRDDADRVCRLMAEVTGQRPAMWGSSIVGSGTYSCRYATARTGEGRPAGFLP